MRKIILFLIALLCCTSAVSAATVTPITVLDQRGYMPSGLFMLLIVIMLATLVVAYRYNDEMCGFISIGVSFMVLWTSRAVDYVTGVSTDSATITVIHTIYQPDIITVFAGICFVLAFLNVYRIYLLSKQGLDTGAGGQ